MEAIRIADEKRSQKLRVRRQIDMEAREELTGDSEVSVKKEECLCSVRKNKDHTLPGSRSFKNPIVP